MVLKYFCDICDREIRKGEDFYQIELMVGYKTEAEYMLCKKCYEEIRKRIEDYINMVIRRGRTK